MSGHDVHIALAPDDLYEPGVNEQDVYEVVIGGWGNTKSAIRRGNQGRELASAETPSIISADEWRGFWISTRMTEENSLEITFGKIGQAIPLMLGIDPDPVDMQYLGLASWGGGMEAFYRNVRTGKVDEIFFT